MLLSLLSYRQISFVTKMSELLIDDDQGEDLSDLYIYSDPDSTKSIIIDQISKSKAATDKRLIKLNELICGLNITEKESIVAINSLDVSQ